MSDIRQEISPSALLTRIKGNDAPVIVDVRSRQEFLEGHVPGARHVPFWAVLARASELSASPENPIVVYCGHGPRAQIAATALRLRGFRDVKLLQGHLSAWTRAGLPLEHSGDKSI